MEMRTLVCRIHDAKHPARVFYLHVPVKYLCSKQNKINNLKSAVLTPHIQVWASQLSLT